MCKMDIQKRDILKTNLAEKNINNIMYTIASEIYLGYGRKSE